MIDASPAPRRSRRDPWEVLQEDGFTLNNGYRAQGDQARIRRQGYSPAPNSDHLRGDAIDLGHPSYSPQRMQARARELLRDYPEARYLYHDGHLHVGVPGWNAAPGTPGTQNFGLPPLPAGAELVQRGNYAPDNYSPGGAAAALSAPDGSYPEIAMSGPNWGLPIAPAIDPRAITSAGLNAGGAVASPPVNALAAIPGVPSGVPAAAPNALLSAGLNVGGAAAGMPTQRVQSANDGMDTVDERARSAMEQALAATLRGDPDAQVLGILEAGGIGPDRYAVPGSNIMQTLASRADLGLEEFRRQHGNTSVASSSFTFPEGMQWPEAEYTGQTVTGPDGAELREVAGEGGTQWVTQNGVRFFRNEIGAQAGTGPEFNRVPGQEGFEEEEAAQRERFPGSYQREVGLAERLVGAPARGIAELAGMPVDAVNGTMRLLGVPVSDNPVLGSNFLKDNWHVPGALVVNALGGNADPVSLRDSRMDAQGPIEDFAQRTLYFAGSNALPAAGLLGRGGQLINRLGPVGAAAPRGGPISGAIDHLAVSSAARPAATLRAEALASVGAAGGQEVARQVFPGSQTAEMLGIIGGGVVGGVTGARIGSPPRPAVPVEAPVPGGIFGRQAGGEAPRAPDRIEIGGTPAPRPAIEAPTVRVPDRIDVGSTPYARAAASIDPVPVSGRGPVARAAMEREDAMPSVSSEVVTGDLPPLPPGATMIEPELGRAPMPEQADPAALAAMARSINPEDVLPRPSNRVLSLDEHIALHDGRWQDVPAPNERAELTVRDMPHPTRPGETVRFAGPVDAETFLRLRGGIQDQAGELRHTGIVNNRARSEVPGEDRLGRILNPQGMTLDEAGEALWEAGYFPMSAARPSVDEVLDMLSASRNGQRTVLPDDVDELTRYHQAQAQRYAVESAAQEGAPLTEDISRPAGEANVSDDIPLTAYDEVLQSARVGNIRTSELVTRNDIDQSLRTIDERFAIGRPPPQSHAETAALADELGFSADDLIRVRQGRAFTGAEALRARQILAKAHEEFVDMGTRLASNPGGTSPEALAMFHQAALRVAAIQEAITRAKNEAGRALQSFRIPAGANQIDERVLRSLISSGGGQHHLENMARAVLEMQRAGSRPGDINRFVASAVKPGFRDMIQELLYSNMLSSPTTHATNTLGNTLFMGMSVPENAVANVLGQFRRALPSGADRVTSTEVAAYSMGLLRGVREGSRRFMRTIRTGETLDPITQVESRRQRAIPNPRIPDRVPLLGGRSVPIGRVVRAPLTALSAEDEFFKGMARVGDVWRQAARMARQEGLRGPRLDQRIAELANHPTPAMIEQSVEAARRATFQTEPGWVGRGVLAAGERLPELKFFIPFVRTIENLVRESVRRSPAAPFLMPSVRRELMAGGARRDLAASRMLVGGALIASAWKLADAGVITGGEPLDFATRDLWKQTGRQPYSVLIGDRYISYEKLEPLSLLFSLAADHATYERHMTDSERNNSVGYLAQMMSRRILGSFWGEGVVDVVEVLEDPSQLANLLAGPISTLSMTNAVSSPNAAADPYQRSYAPDSEEGELMRGLERIYNRVKGRIPGLRETLPVRRNAFGEPLRNDGRWGPDIVSPFQQSMVRQDAVIEEMLATGLRVDQPGRTREGRTLNAEEHLRYTQLSGSYIRNEFAEVLRSDEWRNADQAERRRWWEQIKRDARADAWGELGFGEDGESGVPPLPPGSTLPPLPAGAVPAR